MKTKYFLNNNNKKNLSDSITKRPIKRKNNTRWKFKSVQTNKECQKY